RPKNFTLGGRGSHVQLRDRKDGAAADAELTELGDMLVSGLSTEEIARLLRRDQREVRDKVVEIGRACRLSKRLRLLQEEALISCARIRSTNSAPRRPSSNALL